MVKKYWLKNSFVLGFYCQLQTDLCHQFIRFLMAL